MAGPAPAPTPVDNFDPNAAIDSLLGGGSTWYVPSGPYAGWTWNDLLGALKAGRISESDLRQIIAQSPPTAGGVQLGAKAIDADIAQNSPANTQPDEFGNTPGSAKPVTSATDVFNALPKLSDLQNAVINAYSNAPGLIQGAGMLPTSLADGDIAQRVAQGQSTAGEAYNTLVAKGYSPAKALAYLQTNAKVPASWVPNVTQPQAPQFAATGGVGPNAVATATGNLGNGVRENLPYNGQPVTQENLPYNGQPATTQPLSSYAAGSWQEYAAQAAQRAGLPPDAVVNLLTGEGSGAIDPNSGATWGILPSTAKGMGTSIEAIRADPHLGIDTAVQYLASNAPMFGGDVQKTLASYFIGAGNVQKAEAQAQQNGTDWLTEADKIAAQYGQGTVSDFFASHNLGGAGGAVASTGGTGTTGGGSTTGGWVTGPDGTPQYVPPTPKSAMTLEEQQAANRAAQAQYAAQEKGAIADFVLANPGAKVFREPQSGQYRIEDANGNSFNAAFDQSTGQLVQTYAGRTPGANVGSFANTPAGNVTTPLTGKDIALNPDGTLNTSVQRALLAIDPQMSQAAYQAAHNGQSGTDQDIEQWLGTSATPMSRTNQDLQDLQANLSAVAATGHTLTPFSAAAGGPGLNTPINLAKDLGGPAAGVTALNPTLASLYTNPVTRSLLTGVPDATVQGPDGQQYPAFSSVPTGPGADLQLGTKVSDAVRSMANGTLGTQGEGTGVALAGNPLGAGTGAFSANEAKTAGQATSANYQDLSGPGTAPADTVGTPAYQRDYNIGYSDGAAGKPASGSSAGYSAGYADGSAAGAQQKTAYGDKGPGTYTSQNVDMFGNQIRQPTITQPNQRIDLNHVNITPTLARDVLSRPPRPPVTPVTPVAPPTPTPPAPYVKKPTIYQPPVFDRGGIIELRRPAHLVDAESGVPLASLAMNGAPEVMAVTPLSRLMAPATEREPVVIDPARVLAKMRK